jgi:predicted SAM-dependent methyltransferase
MGDASRPACEPLRDAVRRVPGGGESRIHRVLPYVLGRVPSPVRQLTASLLKVRARRLLAARQHPIRLCLGSGLAPIPDWVNVDLRLGADVVLDLIFGIPASAGSVDCIYAEHLIEHFSLEDGMRLMRDCRRVLAPEGVLRLATPDLAFLVYDYSRTWREHDWVSWPEHRWIDSGARMLNQAFRGWGHLYLYDFDDLSCRLQASGFGHIQRCALGESEHPHLRGLETRCDSRLVIEASSIPGKRA